MKRLKIYRDKDDLWIGAYHSPRHWYFCPLPTIVFRWRRYVRCPAPQRTHDDVVFCTMRYDGGWFCDGCDDAGGCVDAYRKEGRLDLAASAARDAQEIFENSL